TRPRIPILATATPSTQLYTLSLHDALPIYPALQLHRAHRLGRDAGRRRRTAAPARGQGRALERRAAPAGDYWGGAVSGARVGIRSEEHTSELQSLTNLLCRLLLEKKTRRHL